MLLKNARQADLVAGKRGRDLDWIFAALSDPVRRAILQRLDGEDLLVSELAAPFTISLQAVSRHVQMPVKAGCVKQERTDRITRCRLDAGPNLSGSGVDQPIQKYWQSQFDSLAGWLDQIERRKQAFSRRFRGGG